MKKKIIIIGAGIAGLSAGCYGQMNGYDTEIFEMHNQPGGLCTAWKRQEYTFDLCVCWLLGSAPGVVFNQIWRELGALQNRNFVNHTEFIRYEKNNKTFILYINMDQFEKHLLELAPGDAKTIKEFTGAVRKLIGFGLFHWGEKTTLGGRLKLIINTIRALPVFAKYRSISMEKFAAGFEDSFVREAFINTNASFPDFPILSLMILLAWHNNGYTGYPIGGSLPLARSIAARYESLGGKINYRAKVEKILTKDRRTVGIRLADGKEYQGDIIISAADGHKTIFEMLDGKYLDHQIKKNYAELPLFFPLIKVSLGISRDLSPEPHKLIFELEKPITIAERTLNRIYVKHYCFDPTLAPAGKSVVTVEIETGYAYWENLAINPAAYQKEKEQIAAKVLLELDKRFAGLAKQVEVVDVATPVTLNRYTNNWKGSVEGWLMTTRTIKMMFIDKTLPGLNNFYMVGQWVRPGGGLAPVAKTGQEVIQMLCKLEHRKFSTSVP